MKRNGHRLTVQMQIEQMKLGKNNYAMSTVIDIFIWFLSRSYYVPNEILMVLICKAKIRELRKPASARQDCDK